MRLITEEFATTGSRLQSSFETLDTQVALKADHRSDHLHQCVAAMRA